MEKQQHTKTFWVFIVLLALGFIGVGILAFILYTDKVALEEERGNLQQNLAAAESNINRLEEHLSTTSQELVMVSEDREQLSEELEEEKDRNEEFEDQIRDLSGTIGQLDKLSKTDPELLQKYSRVFFLNENYQPEKLQQIDKDYLYREDEPEFLGREVMDYFDDMIEDATDDDIDLWVLSAFRSFDEQKALKGQYLTTYGSGSNAFSADQGYSEHQLGTTIDFTTTGLNGGLEGFQNTEAYEWLTKNAYKYGFVLSYPEGNSYYVFEPWHWRFVGEELARDLREEDQHFYDLDQRELDKYLISIFD